MGGASASGGVHRASACRDRGARGASTSGRVHRASASSNVCSASANSACCTGASSHVRTDSINTFPNSSFCGGLLSCSCGAGEHRFPSVIFVSYRGNADFLLTVTQHRRDPFLLRLELLIASSRKTEQ